MFYLPGQHQAAGLPHNPFKAIVSPRPIGWVSTLGQNGVVNVAPFSFFNAISETPPLIYFALTGPSRAKGVKDSQRNAEETGDFVVNIVSWEMKEAMNLTSSALPPNESEADLANLTMIDSEVVKAPRIQGAPAALECKTYKVLDLPTVDAETGNFMVMADVVGVHIADQHLTPKGLLDVTSYKPLSRLGYMDYAVVEEVFPLARPGQK